MYESIEHCQMPDKRIRLHVVHTGLAMGPLMLLLHGFPEFWYGWHNRPPYLATADQAYVRNRLGGGRNGRMHAGTAGDAVDSSGLEGFWHQLGRQYRSQPPPEIRHAHSQRVQHETVQ
jgi:pimeloyl-ACP methyl ester carboxylesterase